MAAELRELYRLNGSVAYDWRHALEVMSWVHYVQNA